MSDMEKDDFPKMRQYDSDSIIAKFPGMTVRTGGGMVVLDGDGEDERLVFTIGQARLLSTMFTPRDLSFANAITAAISRVKNAGARVRDV